jgi:hypothetical protein
VLGRVGGQVVADGVGVPVGPGDQVLYPVGGRVAEVLGQLPAVLPLGVAEQAADGGYRPPPRLPAGEPAAEALADRRDLVGPRTHLRRRRSS